MPLFYDFWLALLVCLERQHKEYLFSGSDLFDFFYINPNHCAFYHNYFVDYYGAGFNRTDVVFSSRCTEFNYIHILLHARHFKLI